MRIIFHETASGRSPVTEFIDKQPMRDQAVIVAVLEGIEENGFVAKGVQFRQLQGKLWESKSKRLLAAIAFFTQCLIREAW